MKKITVFIIIFLVAFVSACSTFPTTTSSTTQTTKTQTSTNSTTEQDPSTAAPTTTQSQTTTVEPTTTESPTTTTETPTTVTTVTYKRYQDLYFYSVNDFHGGAYYSFESFSQIGAEIKYMKANYDNVFALTNGDIFQGSAISNYYYGRPLVEAMNLSGFDGFVIGNHEFDWGIDKIGEYKDGLAENGEAEFPILAANIYYEDTMTPLEFTVPYIIKETSGVKVGIIGVIGNLINSIAASRVENIIFADPVKTVSDYASYLRTEEAVDVIVVYIHGGSYDNYDFAQLSGLSRIDAIFNGHTHANESGSISRNGVGLFYAQASSRDFSMLARIKLTYDHDTKQVISGDARTYSVYQLTESDPEIDLLFDAYINDPVYVEFVNQVLASAQYTFGSSDLAPWAASVIRDYVQIDIGAVNRGGFRVSMQQGTVTMGDLITIYPFDNVIKTSRMTGKQIYDFYTELMYYGGDVVFDDGLSYSSGTLYINGQPIDFGKYYTVGAVDYIFDKNYYDFLEGEDITQTEYFMRDLLVIDLLNNTGIFNPYNGSSYSNNLEVNWFYEDVYQAII